MPIFQTNLNLMMFIISSFLIILLVVIFLVRSIKTKEKLEILVQQKTQELVTALENIRILVAESPNFAFIIDEDYKLIDCNEPLIKSFGFKDKEDCFENFFKRLDE